MNPTDPRHHANVRVRLDGADLSGFERSEALVLAHELSLLARITIHDATGKSLAPTAVKGLDEIIEHFASTGHLPRSGRSAAALLASIAAGRVRAVARAAEPKPEPAAPTIAEEARARGADLARQEREVEERLAAIRAAREQHRHLLDAGDTPGAAEVLP